MFDVIKVDFIGIRQGLRQRLRQRIRQRLRQDLVMKIKQDHIT